MIEECYDGLATWKGWMRGASKERSSQLKWKVDRGEEDLGLVKKNQKNTFLYIIMNA